MTDVLFETLTLPNGTVVKNRLMKAATSELLATRDNNPTVDHIKLYERIAKGGTGLIISGNVMVDRTALGEPGNVVVEDRRDIEVMKGWTGAVKHYGAEMWMQINHPGKQSPRSLSKEPVAPSAVPLGEQYKFAFNPPRALSVEEIHDIVERFVTTAVIAKEAGFTGVEIHAAHGYLLNQFLSPHDNIRTDEYGGSLENRMRILIEIYKGMREALGDDFSIGLKLNSSDFKEGGFNEEDSLKVIEKMSSLGIDLIEISGGNYENPKMQGSGNDEIYFIDYAKKVKSLVKTPIAVTGGFKSEEKMRNAIEKKETDMIGIARALVLNPELPNEIKAHHYTPPKMEHLTTGIKSLDKKVGSLVSNTYYAQQMHRLARGKSPHIHKNAWSPILFTMKLHGPAALMPSRTK